VDNGMDPSARTLKIYKEFDNTSSLKIKNE
jgi:hypothetical protein